MLPEDLLKKRLDNEGELLANEGYEVKFEEVWGPRRIPVVHSIRDEELPVARRYTVGFRARGLVKIGQDIREKWKHTADLFVLRYYPWPDVRSGAPFRLLWASDIFHPNIAPGQTYGGSGLVCWKMIREWMRIDNLSSVMRGLRLLVEHPNPDDTLNRYKICRDAASYVRGHPEALSGPTIVGEN